VPPVPDSATVSRSSTLQGVLESRLFNSAVDYQPPELGTVVGCSSSKFPRAASNCVERGHMTTEGFADDGTMTKDLAQFDVAQEIADSEGKKPWKSGHYAKTLFKKSDLRIVLISMEKTAMIKDHHADGTISVQVLNGLIRFTVQGSAHDLSPGNVLALGASIRHEVEALEDSAFLLTVSWPDTEKLQSMKHRGYGT
jgi:quercetin dioxygenase-like cupin family protein